MGNFSFYVNPHDTGNSVIVKLHSPDGDSLEIINKTYWYNESQYGFNDYTFLRGSWDDALEDTIKQIRQQYKDALTKQIEEYRSKLVGVELEESRKLAKFNSIFGEYL